MWTVYQLKFPNRKKYIGVTKHSLEVRFCQHVKMADKGSPVTIHAAIRKYGVDSIKIQVLSRHKTESKAKEMEIKWIRKLGTIRPDGYNATRGGNGVIDPSGQSEKKRIKRIKKTMSTKEYKAKQKKIQKRIWTDEMKEQRSNLMKEKWQNSGCHHKKLLNKEERSAINKAIWKKPGYKERMREVHRASEDNKDIRQRISKTVKQLFSDPDYRERHSQRMKIAMNKPEVKKRCSESHKKIRYIRKAA